MNEEAVVVKDVNGDHLTDITYLDAVERVVLTLYGGDRGKFDPPKPTCQAEGVEAISVACLRQSNVHDLIMSNEPLGIVSIIFDPFGK
jgi:hypothetical protein